MTTAHEVVPRFPKDELPMRMRGLPLDRRGYPVPWFVQWFRGDEPCDSHALGAEPNFVVMDERKRVVAVKARRCWVCGQPLGKFLWFVIGPMCAISRTTAEPPVHRECAMFSIRRCPFLSNPRMRRADALKPDNASAPGLMIERNPGVMALWQTLSFKPFEVRGSWLITIGEPLSVSWWREGRIASNEDIVQSVEDGLPFLRAEAKREGREAEAALERYIGQFEKLVP